jgi:hypothetical protein
MAYSIKLNKTEISYFEYTYTSAGLKNIFSYSFISPYIHGNDLNDAQR